jgi:hypothetical protein
MPLSETAQTALLAKGYILPNTGRVDRKKIAQDIAHHLEGHAKANTAAEIPQVALTMGQISTAIFGAQDPDLMALVGQMTRNAADGAVQKALSNGYLVCVAGVKKEIAEGDERTFSARFLSSQPDLVQQWAWAPLVRKQEKGLERVGKLMELSSKRIPALAPVVNQHMSNLKGYQLGLMLMAPEDDAQATE